MDKQEMEAEARNLKTMKKHLLTFSFLTLTLFLGASTAFAQQVQLGLSQNEAGNVITAYLVADADCRGDGISQASIMIRWAEGAEPLSNFQAILPNSAVSCTGEAGGFPVSTDYDYVLCSLEPTGANLIIADLQPGVEVPIFKMSVGDFGTWQLEDVESPTLPAFPDATKPYVNIQNSTCNNLGMGDRN